MKYLVSIIMVLLMVNFLAQAQEGTDADQVREAIPGKESATAMPVKDIDRKKVVEAGSVYAEKTQVGRGRMKAEPQGGREPCDVNGPGNCKPAPNKSKHTDKKGMKGKNGEGQPTATPPTKAANQSQ